MSPAGPRIAPPRDGGASAPRRWLDLGRRRLAAVRRVRPTVEGWIFLATSLAVSLAALNTGNNLLYIVFAAMLSLVALSGVLSEAAISRLRVRRRLEGRVFAGRPAAGEWRLENPRRWLPHLALRVDELPATDADLRSATGAAVPWVPALARAQAAGAWTFDRRGVHRLEGIRVSTTWPFGIFRKWYELREPLDVLVCPTPAAAPPPPPRGGQAGADDGGDRGGGRGELRELRAWREGEDPRLIHWRTSARRDRRIVVDREHEDGGRVDVVVLPPTGARREQDFESALSVATGQVLMAERAGWRIRLTLPARPPLDGQGEHEVAAMLRELALARLPEGAV